ncbi:TPA: hypothetical protein DD449_01485 [Candidatus Berkelbacteria bacterium]|uniref:Methyltransferase n=1 Tax=Berkelbacteria bacterium GW2011_GWE1_39_12 TaxID=1618337 RepID=A0A0G4B3Y7_9BACT|nr:MAG: methyltransferase [Berkelbacteria bacterium GW2011_GWE1_39_12]HBO60342.1 hypothetical protein [Candidatus Berkelbacteria bacterium]
MYILIVIGSLILFLWQLSNLISIIFGTVYVQSDKKTTSEIIKLFAKKDNLFCELGSGNGEILKQASDLDMEAIGYEISPFYFLLSKIKTFTNKKIKVIFKNVKDAEIKKANLIYCYFLPDLLEKLSTKFETEIKKGAVLISKGFEIKKLKLYKKIKVKEQSFFIYKF